MFWNDWYEYLEGLDPEDAQWDHAQEFVERLNSLLEQRQKTLQSRATLVEALKKLREECSGELAYFELRDIVRASPDRFPVECQTDVTHDIFELHQILLNHATIRRSNADTRQQELERRASLDSLGERILALHRKLVQRLATTGDHKPGQTEQEHAGGAGTDGKADFAPSATHEASDGDEADSAEASGQSSREDVSHRRSPHRRRSAPIFQEMRNELYLEDLLQRIMIPREPPTEIEQDKEPGDDDAGAASGSPPTSNEKATDESAPVKIGSEPDSAADEFASYQSTVLTGHEVSLESPPEAEPRQEQLDEAPRAAASNEQLYTEGTSADSAEAEIRATAPDGVDAMDAMLEQEARGTNAQPVVGLERDGKELAGDDALQPCYELVRAGDLAGAYWWCRSAEAAGTAAPFPSWLLAAFEASRCEPARHRVIADDLLNFTTRHQVPDAEEGQLLALAAAICPALMSPHANTAIWLNTQVRHPALRQVVDAIKDFSRHGRPLKREDVGERRSREETEERVREAALAAQRWLQNAPSHRTKLGRATRVWMKLVRPGGQLHDLLRIAARDARSDREKLREALEAWRERSDIVERIDQIDVQYHGRGVRSIQASPKEQIVNWVFEAGSVADEWLEATESHDSVHGGNSWLDEQVRGLRRSVQENLGAAVGELQELLTGNDRGFASAAVCLLDSLGRVGDLLQLDNETLVRGVPENPVEAFVLRRKGGILERLTSRLWLLADIRLDEEGRPPEETLPSIAGSLADTCRIGLPFRKALEARIACRDFRFSQPLMEALGENEWAEANERYTNLLEASRLSLGEQQRLMEVEVEKAVSDGVIVYADRSEYLGTLSSILPSEVENFAPEFEKIEAIRESLTARRKARREGQKQDWEQKKDKLLRLAGEPEQRAITAFLENALENQDTRVVDECLSRLQEAEHDSVEPRIEWFRARATSRDVLSEFLSTYDELERAFAKSAATVPQILNVLGQKGQLPKPRESEADAAMTAWRRLRQGSARNSEQLHSHVNTILEYLGFRPGTEGGAITRVAAKNDWAHFVANVTAGNLALVPQFGSLREEHFDVICVWERPGSQTLGARVTEAGLAKQPAIVLYLGRLKQAQRLDLARHCSRESMQTIVIDQILLAFLAGERDARLPVAFSAALPFSAINPYAPHSAGNVPPEMFFGRDRMNRALQDFSGNGSCLVYGGRQLGKSALLRRVQREFHKPDQQRYAIYEDIRLVGDALAGQSAESLWIRIRDQLNQLGIFAKALTTDRAEGLIRRLLDLLEQNKRMRILLLLDEADSFLEQDAEQQFAIVSQLKKVMEDSQRRFKVVFAGLHNVQRFQGIPNQPFAHLGISLQVGPLNPLAAQRLVKHPFEAAGYRFADDSLVLRILSYTNYHPGLIQLFCSKLLDELHRKVGRDGAPPYAIESDDIQAVYNNRKLEQDIRDRFDWTLALDPRYQAIAWAIIEDQFDDRDSFARPYTSRDVKELVNQYWADGFRGIASEGLRGLLDEMCGLGVLVRAEEGYRLRSPNLVHLMGTREDIFTRLFELSEKDAVTRVFNADVHRTALRRDKYSPFTHSQARSLSQPSVGACFVFGSDALGLSRTEEAIATFLPRDLPEEVRADYAQVPEGLQSGQALLQWLGDYWEHHRKYSRLIVSHRLHAASSTLDLAEAALEFCRRHQKSQVSWIRVMLLFDPTACWNWLQIPNETRRRLEDRADAIVPLTRWTREAIHLRLAAVQKMDTEAVCEHVERVTGGWPLLLDELFKRSGGEVDPRPAMEQIERELAEDSELKARFRTALGIDKVPQAGKLLGLVKSLGEFVDRELLLQFAKEEGLPLTTGAAVTDALLRLGLLVEDGDEIRVQQQVGSLVESR